MDAHVLRGMARWPDVPAVYGWLALDRRGQWSIRGDRIGNPVVRGFIARNYAHDDEGRWFFQNGPQRVFVTLEYTPLVYRVASPAGAPLALESHTGAAASGARGVFIDEDGSVLVDAVPGVGVVHDADLETLAGHFVDPAGAELDEDAVAQRTETIAQGGTAALALQLPGGRIPVAHIATDEVARRFGFVATPQAPEGEAACT